MHNSNKNSSLIGRINIYSQLFILNLIDITVFGGGLMTKDSQSKVSGVSMVLTFFGLILSQLNFNFFTKIPSAICAGPILEATSLLLKLCDSISHKVSDEEVIVNCLVAISISTLLFGMISIVFSIFDISHYLFLIPHSVITGILSGVGIMLVRMSFDLLKVNEPQKENLGNYYFLFILLFCGLIFFLERKYTVNYLGPLSALVLTVILHLVKIIFKLEDAFLLKYTVISSKVSLNEGLLTLRDNLQFRKLKLKLLLGEYDKILALTFFYLLHLPINLSSFSKVTKVKANLKKEFRTQGISNLIGSIFAFPVYFVCCYSIMIHESGCSSFLDGISLSLVYALNYFIAGFVRSSVPVLGLTIFPVLIGYSFCFSGLTNPFYEGSVSEFIIIWVIAILAGCNYPMYLIFVLGLLLAFVYFLVSDLYYKKSKEAFNHGFMEEYSKKSDYLKVDYILFFMNINRFLNEMKALKKEKIIIDLIGCGSFDMLGNEVFRDSLLKEKKYVIVGQPAHFNVGPVSGMKNVVVCRDYLEASEEIHEMEVSD